MLFAPLKTYFKKEHETDDIDISFFETLLFENFHFCSKKMSYWKWFAKEVTAFNSHPCYRHLAECGSIYLGNVQECLEWTKKVKQEVVDDLSICVLNILCKVSSLSYLLAVNLTNMEIQIFQTLMFESLLH